MTPQEDHDTIIRNEQKLTSVESTVIRIENKIDAISGKFDDRFVDCHKEVDDKVEDVRKEVNKKIGWSQFSIMTAAIVFVVGIVIKYGKLVLAAIF